MSSIIKVGKVQSSTGQDAIEIANDGTITANGAIDSLKTDTISEKTSANGVSIDGLKVKDYSLMYGSNIGLTVNSTGLVTEPNKPMVSAYISVAQTSPTTQDPMVFQSTNFNVGSHYNTSNGRFTCPVSGYYWCHYHSNFYITSDVAHCEFQLNGSLVKGRQYHGSQGNNGWYNFSISNIISASATDYITLKGTGVRADGDSYGAYLIYLLS